MVQRYDCRGAVVTHEAGPFVKYEDYAALKEWYDTMCEKWLKVNGQHAALKEQFMDYMVAKEKQIANLEKALGEGETKYD